MPDDMRDRAPKRSANIMLAVRYGLPAAVALAGLLVLVFNR